MTLTNATRAARCRNAIVTVAIAVILLCAGRASAWAATSEMPPPISPVAAGSSEGPSTRGTPATGHARSVAESYADREASARNLESFKGGDVVIVGSTGVIVVLLVIIILLSL
jgi:hypothetical protein